MSPPAFPRSRHFPRPPETAPKSIGCPPHRKMQGHLHVFNDPCLPGGIKLNSFFQDIMSCWGAWSTLGLPGAAQLSQEPQLPGFKTGSKEQCKGLRASATSQHPELSRERIALPKTQSPSVPGRVCGSAVTREAQPPREHRVEDSEGGEKSQEGLERSFGDRNLAGRPLLQK